MHLPTHVPDVRAPEQFAAIVVCFRPTELALEVITSAASQCAQVVVVDNTPAFESSLVIAGLLDENVTLLRPGTNLGLAGGLNLGITSLGDCEAVLLLDQDSVLPPGHLTALAAHLSDPSVLVAAPAPWDAVEGRYLDPRTSLRPEVAEVECVITSGMIVRAASLRALAPLREEFFLDCVDQDLCLRLRAAGGRVLLDRRVRLPHRLGETRWHSLLGLRLRATHHPTWRLYAMARNGVTLSREHARSFPRWSGVNLLQLCYVVCTVAAFEPPRRERLACLARGVWDGFWGRPPRMGPPAEIRTRDASV